MLLTGRTPWLKVDNFMSPLVQTYNDDENLLVVATHMIGK
jgi:hypothetical protein